MMVVPRDDMENTLVRGICGQVDGSIIPGMIGLEAGQSAFGDTYAWYRDLLSWPLTLLSRTQKVSPEVAAALSEEIRNSIVPALSEEASKLPPEEDAELALDWLNGRRTPDANQLLKGAMSGLTIGSDAPRVFRAWVEATCFGAKAIAERIVSEGIPVKGVIGLGGVARKSPYIMQVMANVMNRSIRIHRSEQTCALGAAMFAATAAGVYPTVEDAMNAMGQGFDMEFHPVPELVDMYERRYKKYRELGAAVENLTMKSAFESVAMQ
jgi:L-ribulokinase